MRGVCLLYATKHCLNCGSLRIGAKQSIGEYLLPQLTKTFTHHYPAVKVKVVIGFSDAVLFALKRHELDVALVASQPRDEDLRGQLFLQDRLVAVMGHGHHLASRDMIHIQELGSEPLILLTELSELRERVVRTFRKFQIALNVQVETGTLESVKKMAAGGLGVGIVPHICVRDEERSGELAVRKIEEFAEDRGLWLAYRNTTALSPSCQAFTKILKAELAVVRSQPAA
jgi:LysR family transcriptional regulator, low CO2-responsive transcriptional regulator